MKKVYTKTLNRIRHAINKSILGRLLSNSFQKSNISSEKKICFVSGTRLCESDFWDFSPLGRTLTDHLTPNIITGDIYFQNTCGLSEIYNKAITKNSHVDFMIFLHDDVWLTDANLIEKLHHSLSQFDIIGIAGNTRILPNQPAWLFSEIRDGELILDTSNLSGQILHGNIKKSQLSYFGKSPAKCELIDGVFIGVNLKHIRSSNVAFDELFDFNFYDLDFCRTARQAHLSIGTWPIEVIHESSGAFNTEQWKFMYDIYLEKWKK